MQLLPDFEPRLVGSVLAGTATEHNDIQLHLFAERAESITFRLMDLGIEHEVVERRVRYGADRVVAYPGVHFEFDDHVVDATVFPDRWHPPGAGQPGGRQADAAHRRG